MKIITILLTAFACVSCISSISKLSELSINGSDLDLTGDTTNYVTRTLDLAGFNAIKSEGIANITYTQGNKYSVVVRCLKEIIDQTDIVVLDSVLTINQDNIKKKNNIPTMYLDITSPDFNSITIEGVTTINAKKIETNGKFDIIVEGVSNINIDSISCAKSKINIEGVCNIESNINATGKIDIDIEGVSKGIMWLTAQALSIDCEGAANMNFDYNGDDADIEIGGVSNIKFNTNCKKLKAQNEGVSTLKISGIAEDTNIISSGVSKINTKELNKF